MRLWRWKYFSPSRTFEVCQNQRLLQECTADTKVKHFSRNLKRIPSQHKACILRPLDSVGLQLSWEHRFCRVPENFTVFYPAKNTNIGQMNIDESVFYFCVISSLIPSCQDTDDNQLSLRNTDHFEGFSNFQRFISLFNFLF